MLMHIANNCLFPKAFANYTDLCKLSVRLQKLNIIIIIIFYV